jgi:uncharacterized membrane protein YadS
MNKLGFPWLALGMGLLVALGLLTSGVLGPAEGHALPLLTMLIVNEFGFFVTAIGAGVGINSMLRSGADPLLLLVTLGCAILAAGFLYLAILLWPGGFTG